MDMPREKTCVILAIISDQNLVRELSKLLQGTTFELITAHTPITGLQVAEELIPDAILVDIDLDGSALETCRGLRANRVLRGMPLLMLCESQDHDSRAMGLSVGVDDFISKPFDAIELLSRLRTITRLNAKRLMVNDLERFNWMASHAEGGYVLLDNSGAIHYANENALALLNLPEDYLGLPFIAVVEHRFKAEPVDAWENWVSVENEYFKAR